MKELIHEIVLFTIFLIILAVILIIKFKARNNDFNFLNVTNLVDQTTFKKIKELDKLKFFKKIINQYCNIVYGFVILYFFLITYSIRLFAYEINDNVTLLIAFGCLAPFTLFTSYTTTKLKKLAC